eukprot:gene16860-18562_t
MRSAIAHGAVQQQVNKPQNAYAYQKSKVTNLSDDILQSIGLKDDASFMNTSPNFDRSKWTLNAFQSIIPNVQAKNNIPYSEKQPLRGSNQKQSYQQKMGSMNLQRIVGKSNLSNSLSTGGKSDHKATGNIAGRSSGDTALQNKVTASKQSPYENHIRNGLLQRHDNAKEKMPLKSSSSSAENEKKKNTIQTADTKSAEKQNLTSDFFKPKKKAEISTAKDDDVIYKEINPGDDVDSDEITAKNLVSIFSALDTETNEAVSEVAKKNDITQSREATASDKSNAQIEMMVLKPTTKRSESQSAVTFVDLPAEKENVVNLAQTMEPVQIKPSGDDNPKARDNVATKRNFNLKRLYFGIANGNMLD